MKFLKLRSILFSLIAVTLVSIFLTSCTKEPGLVVDEKVSQLETKSLDIFLPFDESTSTEILTYKNSAIIFEFLQNKNLLDIVISENTDAKSLSEINLSNYLSNEQTEELNNKLLPISELESRELLCTGFNEYDICVMVPSQWCLKTVGIVPVFYICGWKSKCATYVDVYHYWC